MRKYRSGGFSFGSGGKDFWKNRNFLYIFAAWNVFAVCFYTWFSEKKVKDKEKWKQMTPSEYWRQ